MSSTTAPPPAETARGVPAQTLVAGCAAVFLAQLGLVLPAASNGVIQATFHTSGEELTWVSDAYLVPIAMTSLTFGVLGDRFGRKKLLVGGASLMALGYLISALSGVVALLWLGQALCGIGAAALFASSLTIITAATPGAAARARGLAAWTTALSTGALIAPPLSGVVVQIASIQWVFGVAGAIALLVALLCAALTAESTAPQGRALDWPGQITIAAALLALLFGVIEGPSHGWSAPVIVAAFVVAALLLAAFVVIERRTAEPMLRLDLFAVPAFSASAVVAVIGMFGFLGGAYVLSIRLGIIAHQSALAAAVPFVVVQGITPFIWPVLVRLLHRVGPRVMLVAGLLCLAVSQFWLRALLAADGALLPMLPALVLMGLGFGLLVSALTAAAVNSVPVHLAGMASGTTNMVRDLGQTLGPALVGTVALGQAAALLAGSLQGAGLPEAQLHVAQGVLQEGGPLALATAPLGPLSGTVGPLARAALTAGYASGLLVTAVACLVAAAIAATFVRGGRSVATSVPGEDL
jgi:MFS family permease